MKTRTSFVALLLLAPSAASQALIVPTTDTRTVWAHASEGPLGNYVQEDEELIRASGFGLFQAFATAQVSGPNGFADGFAIIDSDIQDTRITVEGSTAGNGSLGPDLCGSGLLIGEVEFDVTAPSYFRFHGFVEGYDQGYGQAYLFDGADNYLGGIFGLAKGVVPFEDTGVMQPGPYRLEFRGNGGYCSPDSYAFTRIDVALDLTPMGTNFCSSSANSSGSAATIGFSGTSSLAANDLVLQGTGGPAGAFGLFVYSPSQGSAPVGDGTLCVGSPFRRLGAPVAADANGNASLALDLGAPPLTTWRGGVDAGSSWHFQWIFRDSVGTGINLSDGLTVNFAM